MGGSLTTTNIKFITQAGPYAGKISHLQRTGETLRKEWQLGKSFMSR